MTKSFETEQSSAPDLASIGHALSQYSRPVAVKDQGKTVGYYIPIPSKGNKGSLSALKKNAQAVSDLLDQRHLSEDDILSTFDEIRKKDAGE